eukprot:CAMPEP_0198422490 /NCGR_PEP_ID=MMETSP1452-20131203/2438_1 /TAXON_ID=1181717 /ORGANISM="Synchroma pusillum, Strain CCMP3072" /LENGTH=93 /DNA_ID=CAMNT_0044142761 /DNA_START=1 /DNA_END=279 /DNA_ORIENTATION=-
MARSSQSPTGVAMVDLSSSGSGGTSAGSPGHGMQRLDSVPGSADGAALPGSLAPRAASATGVLAGRAGTSARLRQPAVRAPAEMEPQPSHRGA